MIEVQFFTRLHEQSLFVAKCQRAPKWEVADEVYRRKDR